MPEYATGYKDRNELLNILRKKVHRGGENLTALIDILLDSNASSLSIGFRNRRQNITPSDQQGEKNPIKISDKTQWDLFLGRLLDTDAMLAAAKGIEQQEVYENMIGDVKKRLDKLAQQFDNSFDESTTGNIVKKVIKVLLRLMRILEACGRQPESAMHGALAKEIDRYLERIGIETKHFRPGDPVDSWIELGMDKDMLMKRTDDPAQREKIYAVHVQPRVIRFINSDNEEESCFFGGKCTAFANVE